MPRKSSSNNLSSSYIKHRERMAKLARQRSASAREIGPLPPVINPERKKAASANLSLFLTTYFPQVFYEPFSNDHLLAINAIQSTILNGGRLLVAMPRASGKSSIIKYAALWALLYGYRRFVVIVSAEAKQATQISRSLQEALCENPLLLEDFPEACYPIARLEGMATRAHGQTLNGSKTNILWSKERIRLPKVPDAPCSGAVIAACGLTGSLRGLSDGSGTYVIRPDFLFLDDPQTDRSAISPSQTFNRKNLIYNAILGLGGPKTDVSAVIACTVIAPNDLSDTLINSGDWQVIRTKLLYAMPKNLELWEEYARIMATSKDQANAFYAAHRQEMDEGAIPAWHSRYTSSELSAIQHAMNLYLINNSGFHAEYQNEPLPQTDELLSLRQSEFPARLTSAPNKPIGESILAIDPQLSVTYYLILSYYDDHFIITDYGTIPGQPCSSFRSSTAPIKLSSMYPNLPPEQATVCSIQAILAKYPDLKTILDVNLGLLTTTLYTEFGNNPNILLSHGSTLPPILSPKRGEITGTGWIYGPSHRQNIKRLKFSSNIWKDIAASLLTCPPDSPRSILFYGSKTTNHSLLFQHLASEQKTTTGWKCRPHEDNHWWDCLVLALLAFDVYKNIEDHKNKLKSANRPIRFSDIQKSKASALANGHL